MDILSLFESEFDRHEDAVKQTRQKLPQQFAELVEICTTCLKNGNKILFFGNGGSASDAQHIATELTVRYMKERKALAALSLSTDTSALTAIGNDYSFEDIFSRQIEALTQKGDVAFGITTSGTSPNIIKGFKMARDMGAVCVGLGGKSGGELPNLCDLSLIVPHQETARVQEMHILLGHMLCEALEQKIEHSEL